MRLLLDEHYPSMIAEQLRRHGFDVIAVEETGFATAGGMRGLSDEPLLRRATAEGRVLVSENIRDLVPLHRSFLPRGEAHAGIILTASRSYSRRRDAVGRLIRALAAFIENHESLACEIVWL